MELPYFFFPYLTKFPWKYLSWTIYLFRLWRAPLSESHTLCGKAALLFLRESARLYIRSDFFQLLWCQRPMFWWQNRQTGAADPFTSHFCDYKLLCQRTLYIQLFSVADDNSLSHNHTHTHENDFRTAFPSGSQTLIFWKSKNSFVATKETMKQNDKGKYKAQISQRLYGMKEEDQFIRMRLT